MEINENNNGNLNNGFDGVAAVRKGDIIKTYADLGKAVDGGDGTALIFGDRVIKLPDSEKIPGERISDGQAVYVYVLDVGENIEITRVHPAFIKKLAEEFLPCVKDRSVEIVDIAREPGKLTKIAVRSSEGGAHAVKLCRSYDFDVVISEELYGEKIQFVRYSENIQEYVKFALLPGRTEDILISGQKKCEVTVAHEQYDSVAGTNLKLASRLCGMKIELKIAGSENIQLTDGEHKNENENENENEKENGGKLGFSDFLYHNKWKIIIAAFALVILVICVAQSFTVKGSDISILCSGGTYLDGSAKGQLSDILAKYVPEDFNGDGEKNVTFVNYLVYSKEEIESYEAEKDENGKPIYYIDRSFNSSEYSSLTSYIQTGEGAICILSGYLYGDLKEAGRLRPLEDILKELPAAAVDGYAIKLSDTKMYAENPELEILPEDTYICILRPLVIGKISKAQNYANEVKTFCAIIGNGAEAKQ